MSDLKVRLGESNGDDRHLVTYHHGNIVFPDRVDMLSAFQRDESIKRFLRFANLKSANIPELSQQLAALAAQVEQQHANGGQLPEIADVCDLCAADIVMPAELIQALLHFASKLLLGGASKAYKSWTLLCLALCVAYGLPWLGCETFPARVLVVNLEIQAAFARRRLAALADALDIVQETGRLDIWNLRGYATSHKEIFPKIERRVSGNDYGLIVLDPIYKLYGAGDNENGASEIAALMNSIESLAVKTGAAVAFGAHYSKGNQASKDAIDRVSGSGVFARDPDTLLNFTRHQENDCYTVEATLRNFPPMEPFVVKWEYPLFVRQDDLNPAALKQVNQANRQKDQEVKQAAKLDGNKKRICNVLAKFPAGESKTLIRTSSGLRPETFEPAWLTLLDEAVVIPTEIVKPNRKKPYDAYRLRDSEIPQE
jgi:hypothetical protein